MTTVWKFSVSVDDADHHFDLPAGAEIVHVACQESPHYVEMWVHLDAAEQPSGRLFRVFGTGQPIPTSYSHRGTALAAGGALVWHLFERVA